MECEEKAKLIDEQSRTALAYSRVAKSGGNPRIMSAQDQKVLYEARIISLKAGAALKRHIAEHGC